MRHPKILYRPMFSTKGASSYGKGIASNLVTEEQRVKYNSGGRVGYYTDFLGGEVTNRSAPLTYSHLGQPVDPFHQRPELWYQPYKSIGSKFKKLFDETGEDKYEKIYGAGSIHGMSPEKLYESQNVPPYKFRTSDDEIIERGLIDPFVDKEKIQEASAVEMTPSEFKTAQEDIGDMEAPLSKMQLKQARKRVDEKFADTDKAEALIGTGAGTGIGTEDTEMLDIQGVIDKYYDKEKSLGEAQLGLAGQVLKAGFQPKSKAMGTIGDAFGAFGKTALADEKEMKKLAATGEIQRELYKERYKQEGIEDRRTAEFKNNLPEKENEAWTTSDRFDIAQAAALKSGKKGDEALADSVEYAKPGTSVKKLSGKTDKTSLTRDAKAIEDGDENTLYIKDGLIWAKDSSGKLTIQVDFEDIGLIEATK